MSQQDETILNVTIDSTKAEAGAKRATAAFDKMLKAFNNGFDRFRNVSNSSFTQTGSTSSRMFSRFQSSANSAFNSTLRNTSNFSSRFSSSINSAISGASAQFRQFQQLISGLGNSFNNLIPPIKKFGSSASEVFSNVRGLISSLTGVLSGLFSSRIIGSIVESGLQMQKFRSTMSVVTGTAAAADVQLSELRKTADKVGISFEQAAGPFARFAAASQDIFSAQEINKIFGAFAEASSALKLNQQEIQGVFLALQQMASKGKVSMEELRLQLAERIPGAMQLAAKSLGITIDQLESDIRQGKVSTEGFLVGFAELISQKFAGAAAVASDSAIGAIARFKNSVFTAASAIADAGLLDAINDGAERLSSHINSNTDQIKEFGQAFGSIIKSAIDGLTKIRPESITNAFKTLVSATQTVAKLINSFENSSFIKWMNGDLAVQQRAREVGVIKSTLELVSQELGKIALQMSSSEAGILFNPLNAQVARSLSGVNSEYSVMSTKVTQVITALNGLVNVTKSYFSSLLSSISKVDFTKLITPVGTLRGLFDILSQSSFFKWLQSGTVSDRLVSGISSMISKLGDLSNHFSSLLRSATQLDSISSKFSRSAREFFDTLNLLPKTVEVDVKASESSLKSFEEQVAAFTNNPAAVIKPNIFEKGDPRFKSAQDNFSIGDVELRRREEESLIRVIEAGKKALAPNRELVSLQERRASLMVQHKALSEQMLSIDQLGLGTQKLTVDELQEQLELRNDFNRIERSILDVDEQIAKLTKRNTSENSRQVKVLKEKKSVQDEIFQNQLKQIDRLNRAADPTIELMERLNTALSLSKVRDPKTNKTFLSEAALQREIDEVNRLLQEINNVDKSLKNTSDGSEDRFDAMARFANEAARNIQDAFSDFFFDPIDQGLGSLVTNFSNAIRRLIAEAAALDFLRFSGLGEIFGGTLFGRSSGPASGLNALTQGGSGAGGGSSLLQLANVASGIGSGKSLLSGAGTLFNKFATSGLGQALGLSQKVALNAVGSFSGSIAEAAAISSAATAGAPLSSAATLTGMGSSIGSTMSAMAGPAAIVAAVDFGLRQIFGDKKLGGAAGEIMSFVPIVGTLINGLFGRGPLTFKNQTLQADISGSGLEASALIDQFKAQGGAFRSSKRDNIIIDTQSGKLLSEFGDFKEGGLSSSLDPIVEQRTKDALQLGKVLNEAFSEISKSLYDTADILGLSTSGLESFNTTLKITSEKGEVLSETQISEAIEDVTNQMVKSLIPAIDTLSRNGESAAQSLSRLNQDFAVIESAFIMMGKSANDASDLTKSMSFEDRSVITDKFGGAANLDSQLQTFFDSVFSESQKLPIVEQRLLKALKPFDIDFIPTLDQLFEAFTSGNPKLVEAALAVDDLVIAYDRLKDSAKTEASRVNAENMQKANRIGSERFSLETQLLTLQGNTLELRRRELAATEPQNRAMKLHIWLLEDQKQASAQQAAIRKDELSVQKELNTVETERLKVLKETRDALAKEVEENRLSLLMSGNASGLVQSEMRLSELQWPTSGKASEFNQAFAAEMATISTKMAGLASENALQIQNVGTLMSSLIRNISSDTLISPITRSIKESISSGSTLIGGIVSKFAETLAVERNRQDRTPRNTGLAAVMSAQSDFSFSSFSGFARGRRQVGRDVVEFGQAIDSLDRALSAGKITAYEHEQTIRNLTDAMGGNASLLDNMEAQIERVRQSAEALFVAGIDSIGFYFDKISDSVSELNKQASIANEPIALVSEAIGRLNSVSTAMKSSVGAVITGLKNSGQFGVDRVGVLSSSVQQAAIIGEAASIASKVITTLDANKFANQLSSQEAFNGSSSGQIKNASLLLDGLKAFDPVSFENAFLRLNDAFIKGSLTQDQYTSMFNLALDTFEGLNSEAGGVTSEFQKLRETAKSLADDLLLNRELTTLNHGQTLSEAQRQFNDVVSRARLGDSNAISDLPDISNTLLSLGRLFQGEGDYNVLFGRTVAILRELEQSGGGDRADFDDVVDGLENVRDSIIDMESRLNSGIVANAVHTSKTSKILDRWDALGLPQAAP